MLTRSKAKMRERGQVHKSKINQAKSAETVWPRKGQLNKRAPKTKLQATASTNSHNVRKFEVDAFNS